MNKQIYKSYLTDTPEELLEALNLLISKNIAFGIMTCRSGLAVDFWNRGEPKRMAYTINNHNNLSETIKTACQQGVKNI